MQFVHLGLPPSILEENVRRINQTALLLENALWWWIEDE
jgi:hypothetical protein